MQMNLYNLLGPSAGNYRGEDIGKECQLYINMQINRSPVAFQGGSLLHSLWKSLAMYTIH